MLAESAGLPGPDEAKRKPEVPPYASWALAEGPGAGKASGPPWIPARLQRTTRGSTLETLSHLPPCHTPGPYISREDKKKKEDI